MKTIGKLVEKRPWLGWALFFGTVVIVFLLGLLASSIVERRAEAVFAYAPQVEFPDWEPRIEVWGANFPRQYESYKNTADTTFRSKYYGSAKRDALSDYPLLVVLWAGHPFSRDYNQGRGHLWAIEDVRNSLRTGAPMKPTDGPMYGPCWTCKSSDVPRMMQKMGVAEFYKATLAELGPEIVNPIGCTDCHDAKTMKLNISRPHLVEAFQRQGVDVANATHQEMRSLVCAQCHVEYYFKGQGRYVTLPWDKGLTMEAMEEHYNEYNFSDWTHSLSRTPMLKAQHPDYELFKKGVHYSRGVSCADCHMPYRSEGGVKFTNHHIQSPLNNVANSCKVCHREETSKMVAEVYQRQDAIHQIRTQLEHVLAKAHIEAKFAWDFGATDAQMQNALSLIRAAQWRWDYVAASHGGSFHAPLECARIISLGMEKAQEARMAIAQVLAQLGHKMPVPMPDLSTKAKAQEYIGLNMKQIRAEKKVFLDEIVPKWIKEAQVREAGYPTERL